MRSKFRFSGQICAGLLALAACATPATKYPIIAPAAIAANTTNVQQLSVAAILERRARVDAIARPLLRENVDLCYKRTRQSFGLNFGNEKTIRSLVDGFTLKQVRALGYDETPRVLGVVAASPAAEAGIEPGARPVRFGETLIDGDMRKLRKALGDYQSAQDKSAKDDGDEAGDGALQPLEMVFEQNGRTLSVALTPETVCNIPINVPERDIINASANGRAVNVFRGLLTYFEDDRDVTIVVAHEIGHIVGRHVPKQQRNAMVSGYALWGVPVGLGAALFDGLFASPLERWGGVERPPGRAGITRLNNSVLGTRNFEREADYLGMYIAARAGADISRAEAVFTQFAEVSPRSTYGENSHPVTSDRMLALVAAREEIEKKRQAGEALVPSGWRYPIVVTDGE